MTDVSTTAPTPAEQKLADDIQPIIEATAAVAPADEVEKVKVFLGKYAKGWVALAGSAATFAVGYLPVDSVAAHVAQAVLAAATVAGVVFKRNGI